MDKIKTVQPYKLYKKIYHDKSNVKLTFIISLILIFIYPFLFGEPEMFLIVPFFLIMMLPIMVYNPFLKKIYQPGKSYTWVKDYTNGRYPSFLTNFLFIVGFVGTIVGLIIDLDLGDDFVFTICGCSILLLAFLIKKFPSIFMSKEQKLRRKHHQNIDYNVKVDLNEIYGVQDKLIISYQNFNFEKKKMANGDYMLGVSPQSVYFISKNQIATKTKIDLADIDTLGLLATIGNVFVFNIISKHDIEINIILKEDDSLVVSPYALFNALLDNIDNFIQNGGVVANNSAHRRKIVTNNETSNASNETSLNNEGRNIDLEETKISSNEESIKPTSNRIVDISFSSSIIEEMSEATYIESNRKIDI